MTRFPRLFGSNPRLRPLVLITAALTLLYVLLRPAEPSPLPTVKSGGLKGDRLAHLVPQHHEPLKNTGFSPIKALGLERLVPGSRKRLLLIGGASSFGQALVPALYDSYEIYILDKYPRPSSLPISPHIHYLVSTLNPLHAVLTEHAFSGIIHLGGIDLEEECRYADETCSISYQHDVNALIEQMQGGSRGGWWKAGTKPWIVLATDAPVTASAPSENLSLARAALSTAESEFKEYMSSLSTTGAGGAIVRFGHLYGYQPNGRQRVGLVQRTLVNGILSGAVQYDSDLPPVDLVHAQDGINGLISAIKSFGTRPPTASVDEYNLVTGELTPVVEVIKRIITMTESHSPLRDLGAAKPSSIVYSPLQTGQATELIGWKPEYDTERGLREAIKTIRQASVDWAEHYLATECQASDDLSARLKNRELWNLDGCAANIAFNRDGFLDYVKCPVDESAGEEDGARCFIDNKKVVSYNWGADVFIIRRQSDPGVEGKITVVLEEEKGRGFLGLQTQGEVPELELVESPEEAHVTFELEVAEDSSFLRFLLPNGQQLRATTAKSQDQTVLRLDEPAQYDARLNLLCCPMEGDWPLLEDDYETADIRFGSTGQIPFNSSRQLHTCQRAEQVVKYHQAKLVDSIESTSIVSSKMTHLPFGWDIKELPACWNDCSSPTICVFTGDCRCVQAECPDGSWSVTPVMTVEAAPKSALGSTFGAYSKILVKATSEGHWKDILLPDFATYLGKAKGFPSLHVISGYANETAIEAAPCHQLTDRHCFSADSILYKAMRHVSVSPDEADLIILPVYQQCHGVEFLLHDVAGYARDTIPAVKSGEKKVALVLTHDWGVCVHFAWELWSARDNLKPNWPLDNMLVWSVMGDYDSPCYRPYQDVVVPPRSCVSVDLKSTFGDMAQVQPARERPRLVTWAGTYWGTGKSERLRMTCERGGAAQRELIAGAGPQSSWISWDYMKELNSARFCPQPKGIAGWSPRVGDAIYAGCIPVLTAEGTHYPFSNALDWTKFSVRLLPTDLDRLEEILEAIPIETVEELQKNLMLIRDAFLYSSDDNPEDEFERRGPMFWALHEAGARLGTQYPTAVRG